MKNLILLIAVLLCAEQAHALRVVCLGDSVTEGYGVDTRESWCARLSGINAGVGGNTTKDGLRRFKRDVLARHPDVVTVMFGLGDSYQDERRVPLHEYRKNLVYMVRALKSRKVRVVLMTSNATRRLVANVDVLPYVHVVRDVAEREDVELVDIYREFSELLTVGVSMDALLMDEIHPNAYGHEIIFEAVRHHVGQ